MSGQAEDAPALAGLWERIRRLEGRTIPLMGRKTITIERVEPEKEMAVAIVLADGTPRTVRRAEVERAYVPGMRAAEIRPGTIRKNRPAMRNASYVAAILRAVSE